MKTNVSASSLESYHNEIKGGKENSQDSIILSAFVAIGKPASARMIQKYLKGIGINIDINVVSRSVNNLHSKSKKIIFFEVLKCEVTGRNVNHCESILKLGQQLKAF
jgi:hypothetical protein